MGIDPVSLGLSSLQAGMGIVQAISGSSKLKDLEKQRTAYQTPEQIDKILQLALSQAGGDTQTRDFQTNQLDKAFAGMLGTAQRLGADPNDLSAMFDQKINGILKVGEQFHASNMESVGKVYNALNLVADNKVAEWRSQEDLLKDKIAAAAQKVQAGYQNIGGGLNTAMASYSSSKTNELFK